MLIYFVCLFMVTVAASLSRRPKYDKAISFIYSGTAFMVLVLLAGLRNRTVGTDTSAYVDAFAQLATLGDVWAESSFEPGYLVLTVVASLVSEDYWALLFVIAIVAVFCYMRSIYALSESPAISLFVFITMGYYTFVFNGARQGLACAIYTLAIGPMLQGNFKKYVMWVLLAACFHKSVVIALPAYFIFRQTITLRFVLLMLTAATIGSIYFGTILDIGVLVSDRYSVYQEMDRTGGKFLTLYYALLSAFFLAVRPYISLDYRRSFDSYLNMLNMGSIIFMVVTISGGYVELTRLAIYFQIAAIFIWPIVVKNISNTQMKLLFFLLFVCSHLGFFYIFIPKMANLYPYEFNQDLITYLPI